MNFHLFNKNFLKLRYYLKQVDGLPLVPWKKLRELQGDRWVDKFKAYLKRHRRPFYPQGAYFWAIHDYMEIE